MGKNSAEPVKRGRQSAGPLNPALRFVVPVVRNLSRLIFKERFEGRDNIPVQGPVLIVLNHISVLDPIATASFVWSAGRLPMFMIKDGVFKAPVAGKILGRCRQIPVSRGSVAAQQSIDDAIAALRAGEVVAVYPEGTVTRDPSWWPMRAKTGVARIALAVPEAQIVPVAQWGVHRAYDYHTKKLRLLPRKRTHIRALPPMDMGAYHGRQDAEAARKLTDEMMRVLADGVGELRGETPPAELYRLRSAQRENNADGEATGAA